MALKAELEPRSRRIRFTYRGPEVVFAIPVGDLDILKTIAGICCDFWNGGNSVILPVDRRGRIERSLAEAIPHWLIDVIFVHEALSDAQFEQVAKIVPRERLTRWDERHLDRVVHPLDLQPPYVSQPDVRPRISLPSYSRGVGTRVAPVVFGRFNDVDRGFYERAFDFEDAADDDLALVAGQLEGWSPLRQSTYLCRAYTQSRGTMPSKTLWVFERATFSGLVNFWNARALMSVWRDECRIVGVPRSGLANEDVLRRILEWLDLGGRGRMKPDLFIAGDTKRAREDAAAAVEALGVKRMTERKLTTYFGEVPKGREAPEYWFFQWLDGPLRRGLVVDDIEVVGPGVNSFYVEPPEELRFRDHGGLMHLDIHELPLAVPLNQRSAELVYQNGTDNDTMVSIQTFLPRGRHLVTPTVPGPEELLRAYVSQHGYDLRLSQDGVLAARLLDRFSTRADLDVLASDPARAILDELAPQHRKKLAKRLARELGSTATEEQLAEVLRREAAFIELQARTLEQISSRTGYNTQELLAPLATLVELGLVVRGSTVRCPRCRIRQFVLLAALDEQIRCYACRFTFTLPVLSERASRELPTSYRLDGLMARGMDQDVVAPLLALRWALGRVGNPPEGAFWPGLELLQSHGVAVEIDVVASDRRQLLFIEAKRSAAGTEVLQLRRLLAVARAARARVVVAAASGTFSAHIHSFAHSNGIQLLEPSELIQ